MSLETQVIEGLYVIKGSLPSGAEVNACILSSEGEAIFIDSLYYPKDTTRLIQIANNEELHPKILVNTHWHIDHTAGNGTFVTPIISQTKCVGLMKSDLPKQLVNARDKIGDIQVRYPDSTIEDSSQIQVGDKQLKLVHLPGHTPDSIVCLVEKDRLLIAGDTVMALPFVQYGSSGELLASLRTIKGIDIKTIVQGHGGLCDRSKLDLDIEYLEKARKVVGENVVEGKTLQEILLNPIEHFLSEVSIDSLPVLYKERIHRANLERIYHEMLDSEGRDS